MPVGDERPGAGWWAALAVLVLPVLAVWPFLFHPPAALALKEALFQCLAPVAAGIILWGGIPRDFPRRRTLIAGTLLCALPWVSAVANGSSATSLQTSAIWMTYPLFAGCLGILAYRDPQRAPRRVIWVLLPAALPALLFLLQSAFQGLSAMGWLQAHPLGLDALTFHETTDGPSGTFTNRNQLASLLVLIWPLSLCLPHAAGSRSRPRLYFSLAPSVLVLSALLLCRTEGALLGWIASLLWIGWRGFPAVGSVFRDPRRWMGALLGIFLAVCLSIVLAIAFLGPGAARHLPRNPAVLERAALWRIAALSIADAPWLGYGPGSYDDIVLDHQGDLLRNPAYAGVAYLSRHAHNDGLQAAAETGLPFAALWILFFALGLHPAPAFEPSDLRRSVMVALGAGILGLLVHGLVHYPLYTPGIRPLVLGMLGLRMGLSFPRVAAKPTPLIGRWSILPFLALFAPGLLVSVQGYVAESSLDKALSSARRARYPEAEAAARRAATLRPQWAVAWNNLSTAQAAQGNWKAARASLERALQACRGRDPQVLSNAASQEALLGDLTAASDLYRRALERNPLHIPSLLGRARTFELQGHPQEAADLYRRVLELQPGHRAALEALGRVSPRGSP